MDATDEIIQLNIIWKNNDKVLEINKYSTLGELKREISEKYSLDINQYYTEFSQYEDNHILDYFLSNFSTLVLCDKMHNKNMEGQNMETNEMETELSFNVPEEVASLSFVSNIFTNYTLNIVLNSCTLEQAIDMRLKKETCKILLLCMYNESELFSKAFSYNLVDDRLKALLEKDVFLLGWDIEDSENHPVLLHTLRNFGLHNLCPFINNKQSCLCGFIYNEDENNNIKMVFQLSDSFNLSNLITRLENTLKTGHSMNFNISMVEEELMVEISEFDGAYENTIEELNPNFTDSEPIENEIKSGAEAYQQAMYDLLGDRAYDNYDYNEHHLLEEKVSFALFGPPILETGYEDKQKQQMLDLVKIILRESNLVAKRKDQVVMAIIYVCAEPLEVQKKSRKKQAEKEKQEYNPDSDFIPYPVFVLRKCFDDSKEEEALGLVVNPCRIFIDHGKRVYDSWQSYLENNELEKCVMVVPVNGRYTGNAEDKVEIERRYSPACGLGVKVLKVADIASTAVSLTTAGVMGAALIPAIPMAPVLLPIALVGGLVAGGYGVGRSIATLVSRSKHKEDLSLSDSQSRGAYLNIIAGAFGLVGAGANVVVTQLATRGVALGQGATVTLNALNVTNLGIGGVSVANSGYDVLRQWIREKEAPSVLTIVQLSSSILFFGHAVYNFRSVNSIVDETQATYLKDYREGLRSNRHRKTFDKITKETIRQSDGNVRAANSDIIRYTRSLQNKDEVFAALTRNNKNINKLGVKFHATNGELNFNGVPIDVAEFTSVSGAKTSAFLHDLPRTPAVTSTELTSITTKTMGLFSEVSAVDASNCVKLVAELMGPGNLCVKVVKMVTDFMFIKIKNSDTFRQMQRLIPCNKMLLNVTEFLLKWLISKAQEFERMFDEYNITKDEQYYHKIFDYISPVKAVRVLKFLNFLVDCYLNGSKNLFEDLLRQFHNWSAEQILSYCESEEQREKRENHSPQRSSQKCLQCKGSYYQA